MSSDANQLQGGWSLLTDLCTVLNIAKESCIRSLEVTLASLFLLERLFARVLKNSDSRSSPMPPFVTNTNSLVVYPLLLVFLLFEERSCVFAPFGPGINMRYAYVKEWRHSRCPKSSCLHIQPRFSTYNSGLKIKYLIVEWLQEWLCLHISAHFADVWCQKISDSIMSLSYKTSLLAWQRMVDSQHFSTSTATREIRQREVIAKAWGVPKLLLIRRQ